MKKSIFKKIGGLFLGLAMAVGVGVAVASNSEAVPVHATDTYENLTYASTSGTYFEYSLAQNGGSSAPNHNSDIRIYNKNTLTISAKSTYSSSVSITSVEITGKNSKSGKTQTVYFDPAGGAYVTSGSNVTWGTGTGSATRTATFTGSNLTSVVFYQAGANNVQISNLKVNFTLADKTLSSISVSTAPTKTSYLEGEYFSPSGLVIKRTYTDSTSDTYAYAGHTSEFTFSPSTSTALTTSNTSVTITYGGKSTSQAITVTAPKTPASVSSSGQTTTFDSGDTFAYGGTLTATYTDSTSAGVTPTSFKIGNAGINPTSAGTVITPGSTALSRDDHNGKTVYVLYTENATTVYTSYTISVAAVNKVTFTGGTDKGSAGGQGQSDSLTKSGVTMACDSCYTTSGAYRFYSGSTLTISSTVGNIAQIEFNMNGSYNSNLLSTSTGTYNSSVSTKGIWTGDAASIDFDLSAQARVNSIVITLASADPLVELDVSSATSVNMLDGDTNSTVKVLAKNIDDYTAWVLTFDEDDDTGLSSSDYVTVVPGAFSNNVSTFAITAKKVGSTILNIQLDGTDCEDTVEITIGQKPASITITHSDVYEKDNKLQLDLKAGGAYKQMTFSGKDIRGNTYAVAAADVTPSYQSGSDYVTIGGTRITPKSTAGTAVVRYTLNDLTSVYVDLTVNVISDRNVSVNDNGITYVASASGVQGEPLEVSDIISTTSTTTLFGETGTIADGEYLFAYSNNRSIAVGLGNFVYEITDDTLNAGEFENREIFVFVSFDESYVSSTHVDIEAADRPVSGLIVDGDEATNMDDFEIPLQRFSTYDLKQHVTVNPVNATDSHEITYTLEDGGDYVTLNNGVITAGQKIGETVAAVTATPVALPSFSVTFWISITREVMTLTADVPVEAYVKVTKSADLTSGDYLIVCESEGVVFDGSLETLDAVSNIISPTISSGTIATNDTTNASVFTYDASANTLKSKNDYYIGNKSDSNALSSSTSEAYTNTLSIDNDGNANIVSSGGAYLRYNKTSNQTRFRYYKSSSYTGQVAIQLYKLSNGSTKETSVTVSDELFNIVNAAMTASNGVYGLNLCDSSGTTFNTSAWNTLGSSFTSTIKENNKLAYARADQNGNEIEQFLYVYDYVIGKKEAGFAAYSGANDFLGRVASGKVASTSPRINPILALNNVDNSVWVISAVALVGLTAIGGYFFYRKRKEI